MNRRAFLGGLLSGIAAAALSMPTALATAASERVLRIKLLDPVTKPIVFDKPTPVADSDEVLVMHEGNDVWIYDGRPVLLPGTQFQIALKFGLT